MEIIAGQNDTAEVGTVVPISAKITDANGTIVPGQLVNWVITAGSGSLFVAASIADQSGIARNRLSLGSWENRVELRSIDGQGNAVTYAVVQGLGGHRVTWQPLYFGDPTTLDGSGFFIIRPGVPYDLTQHMSFQILDLATGKAIPNFIIPPGGWYYWGNGMNGDCTGDVTAIVCSGPDTPPTSTSFLKIRLRMAPRPDISGIPTSFLWTSRAIGMSRALLLSKAPTVFVAAFTYSCGAKHVCNFDASSSTIPNGVGQSGYNWTFGDGYQGTRVTVQHTYPGAGTYSVTMSVSDTKMKNARVTKSVIVP
jgi:hypothetical protein